MTLPTIFISYSSQDRPIARLLVKDLRRIGARVWFDEFEVLVGHDISDKVYKGLTESDYVAVVLTENSVKSQWVQEELSFAKQKSITDGGKRVILPLLFRECEMPPAISTLRYADFRESYDHGLAELAQALGMHLVRTVENPIPKYFWDKLHEVLSEPPEIDELLKLEEAVSLAKAKVDKAQLALFYTLKWVRAETPSMAGGQTPKTMENFISEQAEFEVWSNAEKALHFIPAVHATLSEDEIIDEYRSSLLNRIYAGYHGLKYEAYVLSEAKEALRMIVSVYRRLREAEQ